MSNNKTIGVSGGMPISQEDIERLADEAESGYDESQLQRGRGRPPIGNGPAKTVQARLDPDLYDALKQRVEADHTSPSQVVRDALQDYLGAWVSNTPGGVFG